MGNSHPAHFFGVIFAVQNVPLLAAFEDLLLLGTDLLPNLRVDLLFFLEQAD